MRIENRIEAELTPLAFHSAADVYLQDTAHVLATFVYLKMFICRTFPTEIRNCLQIASPATAGSSQL